MYMVRMKIKYVHCHRRSIFFQNYLNLYMKLSIYAFLQTRNDFNIQIRMMTYRSNKKPDNRPTIFIL